MTDLSKKRKRSPRSLTESNKTVKGIFKKDDIEDSLSTSDWGVDNNNRFRGRTRFVKLNDEPLSMTCEWKYCCALFTDYHKFNAHLKSHLEEDEDEDLEENDALECFWVECHYQAVSHVDLSNHLCFHGYHTKLKSIGRNVEERAKLPPCTQLKKFMIPVNPVYECDWEYCGKAFGNIYEYLDHVKVHIHHNPKGRKEGKIVCGWKGCKTKSTYDSQYKLSEHVRAHSKEKLLACATCGFMFACKTKLCDHRRRQIPTNQQSYLCSQCMKYCPSERLLRDHMRLHINHYKCSMCEMTCPKPSTLAKHFRHKHMNVKPFKCPKCTFRFVSKHNLDFHIRTHVPDNIFKCSKCKFACRSEFGLKKHEKLTHSKGGWNEIYECHNCKKRFNRGGLLTRHLMNIHNYHWPSGHSRFRYKKDPDKIYRLQTVRYETLDVTQEIIKGKTAVNMPTGKKSFTVSLEREKFNREVEIPKFKVVLSDKKPSRKRKRTLNGDDTDDDQDEKSKKDDEDKNKTVFITIKDVDAKGNILKSETIESTEIVCSEVDCVDDPSTAEEVLVFRPEIQ